MNERVKQYANAIIPMLSIPDIFPDICIEDLPKISKEFEKLLTSDETHTKESMVCKRFPIGITCVCGLDIIEINFADLLKIIKKENETEDMIHYIQSRLSCKREETTLYEERND